MDRKNHLLLLALAFVLALGGCRKDQPPAPSDPPGDLPEGAKVWVVCEGNLGAGNSSLGLYDPHTGSYRDPVFPLSQGASLGDVFESMAILDNRLFLLMNNSDRIRVLDKESGEQIGSLDLPKPRRMVAIPGDKAYVSSLYSSRLYLIHTRTLSLEKTITLPYANAESMVLLGDELWVACWDPACYELLVLDAQSGQIKAKVALENPAPHTLAPAPGGKLWVLSGNAALGLGSALTRIDLGQRQKELAMQLPDQTEGIRLAVDSVRGMLYYIGLDFQGGNDPYGLFRLSLEDRELPEKPWIESKAHQYFWGVGLDPQTGDIYLADPRGFIQRGEVNRYSAQGEWKDRFETSIGPNSFYFDPGP